MEGAEPNSGQSASAAWARTRVLVYAARAMCCPIVLRSRRTLAYAWFAGSLSLMLAFGVHAQDAAPAASAAVDQPAAASEPTPAITPVDAARHGRIVLARSLAAIEYDQRHTSMLLPWAVTVAGAVVMLTGLVVGVHAVLDCSDSCTSSFWPGWIVIGGATLAEVGTVWILIENHDRAELQLRHDQLEEELRRMQWNAAPRTNESPQAALSVHGAF